MSEISVSKITNLVTFKVDQNSYSRAIKAIRKVASEWGRATSKMNSSMAQGRAIGGGGRGSPRTPRVSQSDRAQEVISAGNIRRQSMYGTGGSSSMSGTIGKLNAELKSGAISLQVYRQQVAAVEREFRRAQASASTFGDNIKGLRTAFIALTAGNMLFTGGRAAMQTGQMFQGIEAAMSMTSETGSETAEKIKYIRDEAYRLGLDLKTASNGFVQMSVAAKNQMTSQQLKELFSGFSEYTTALGTDPVRFERGITAIGQMLN
jgi:hypothetical protein